MNALTFYFLSLFHLKPNEKCWFPERIKETRNSKQNAYYFGYVIQTICHNMVWWKQLLTTSHIEKDTYIEPSRDAWSHYFWSRKWWCYNSVPTEQIIKMCPPPKISVYRVPLQLSLKTTVFINVELAQEYVKSRKRISWKHW